MKFLFDLFPLLLFFAAYLRFDIYVATGVAIVASLIQVVAYRLVRGRFETAQLIGLAAIAVFGGLTLLVRGLALLNGDGETMRVALAGVELELNARDFIKWKPTVVYWILALLVFGSHLFGKKPLLDRMLGAEVQLPPQVWKQLNLSWGIFFLVLGALNIYVAFHLGFGLTDEAREKLWVYFKVPGSIVLTLLFIVIQAVYMARHLPAAGKENI